MNLIGQLAALGAALTWTFAGLINERYTKGASGTAINFLRICLGFILITILSIILFGRWIVLPVNIDGSLWLILSGLIGFAIGDSYLMMAFQELGARITLLIFSIAPVLAAIASYLIFHETLSGLNMFGMALTLIGLMIVITSKDNDGRQRFSALGIRAALIASLGQAAGIILSKLGLQTFEPIAATQIRLMGAIVGLILFLTIARKWDLIRTVKLHKTAPYAIVGNAFLATLIGVSLSMVAIKHTKAAIASTLMSIMPILIIPLSIWLKEQIHVKEVLGAILSVAGIAILFL